MSRVYPLADRLLGGTLTERLQSDRDKGLSYRDIAAGLAADGVEVTGETVRSWCREHGIVRHEQDAA